MDTYNALPPRAAHSRRSRSWKRSLTGLSMLLAFVVALSVCACIATRATRPRIASLGSGIQAVRARGDIGVRSMRKMGAMGVMSRGKRSVLAGRAIDPSEVASHISLHKEAATHAATHAVTNLQHHMPQIVASVADAAGDAAAATTDAATQNKGPFGAFVNLIAGTILFMSNNLEKAGLDQSIGLSIVLFTLGVKALTFPLSSQQIKSSEVMQMIQPKVKQIQEKYKDDPNKSAQMIQEIYSENKVNPLAGLVPTFAQIPIFIGLYRALQQLATQDMMNQAFLWLPNLEGPTYGKMGVNWLSTGQFGPEETLAYLSLPIILIASQIVSQRLLTTKEQYDAQPSWTKFLPILFGYFSVNVPSGLAVYWVTNNLVTTGANFALKQKYKNDPEVVRLKEKLQKIDAPVEKQMPYVKPKQVVMDSQMGGEDDTPKESSRGKGVPPKKKNKKNKKKDKKNKKATTTA